MYLGGSEMPLLTDTHSTQWEDPRVIKLQNEQASVNCVIVPVVVCSIICLDGPILTRLPQKI